MVYTILGSLLWVPFFTITGYLIGENAWVKDNYLVIFLGLIIVTLLPFFYNVFKMMFTKAILKKKGNDPE
jgi:membrane-associated protein